jgi:hypothetical protein
VSGGRPPATPGLVAGVMDRLPARIRRRLDERRHLAEEWGWAWHGEELVVSAPGATVRVRPAGGEVGALDQVACDCLLAPRCAHVAAVVLALPLSEAGAGADAGSIAAGRGPGGEPDAGVVPMGAGARAAAEAAWQAGALLLEIGAASAGLVVQGELLRAAHACRLAGLHRAAAALTRTVGRLADLRAQRPEYRLDFLLADVSDALTSALALGRAGEAASRSAVGVARRTYAPAGSLRLSGVLTEAVMSAAGYAGVVTCLVDQEDRRWTFADVAPGEVDRVAAAYDAGVEMGDLSISHRTLGRSSVFVQRAAGSPDGRLGAGRRVGAVRGGPAGWDSEPLASLFRRPVAEQLDAAYAALPLDATLRRAGWDLLFVEAAVIGVRRAALVLETEAGEVSCSASSDHEALPYRRNLRLLGGAPGLRLRAAGRVLTDRPRSLALLAVGPAPGEADGPTLALPPEWTGRANLGVDALQSAHVAGAGPGPVELPDAGQAALPDPLDPLARRLGQALTGGRVTQGETAWAGIDRDAALLRRRHLPGAAQRLEELRAAALRGQPGGRERFALAWTAAWTYHVGARNRLSRTSWSLD